MRQMSGEIVDHNQILILHCLHAANLLIFNISRDILKLDLAPLERQIQPMAQKDRVVNRRQQGKSDIGQSRVLSAL